MGAAEKLDELDDVLDVRGAMALLKLGRDAIYAGCARQIIPHRRIGRHIRFSRTALLRWLDGCGPQGASKGQSWLYDAIPEQAAGTSVPGSTSAPVFVTGFPVRQDLATTETFRTRRSARRKQSAERSRKR